MGRDIMVKTIKIQKGSTATFLQAFLNRFLSLFTGVNRRSIDRVVTGFVLHDARELASQQFSL